jgi:hypothetical protein
MSASFCDVLLRSSWDSLACGSLWNKLGSWWDILELRPRVADASTLWYTFGILFGSCYGTIGITLKCFRRSIGIHTLEFNQGHLGALGGTVVGSCWYMAQIKTSLGSFQVTFVIMLGPCCGLSCGNVGPFWDTLEVTLQ